MSLPATVRHALLNPIQPRGRNSISRFACLITDGRRFFYGWNSYKTHPLQARFSSENGNDKAVSIHAELSALVKAARSGIVPGQSKVYIARVLRDGTIGLAKPCPGCLAALTEFGFTDIEYTGEKT